MPYVRCSYCQARRTLARHPDSYQVVPRCRAPGCAPKQRRRQVPQRYYVDRWRAKHERSVGNKGRCYPGRSGCSAYHFPHRRGSGACWFNPNIQER